MSRVFLAEPIDVLVPEQDIARQAVASLRGYAYQIWVSALAWTRLKGSETLLLEIAEDFATLSADVLAMRSVKDTAASRSATLRTKGVVDAINALWRYQEKNATLAVSLVYLTTSTVGREQHVKFPGGVPGLVYWRTAARDHGDVEPIRAFLKDLDLEPELQIWMASASANDFRDRILRPIHWECGQPTIAEVDDLLDETLVLLGDARGLVPRAARVLRDLMLVDLLRAATNNDPDQRRKTLAQLLELVDRIAGLIAPEAVLKQLLAANAAKPASILEPVLPPSGNPRLVSRDDAVRSLVSVIASGVGWLYGASGTGKTGLATGLAGITNRSWQLLDLRDVQPAEAARRIRMARQELTSFEGSGGVIVDDFPSGEAASVKRQLALLRRLLGENDVSLLVVSYKPPPPSLQADLDLDAGGILEAPYFSEDEVGALVSASGGDPELWAKPTHFFCGNGHPQLVAARVAGLRSRGWPRSDLLDVLKPSGARDIEAEREAVRLRLYEELPAEVRGLLQRLSLISGAFDRELAIALGDTPPPLLEPGMALDLLTGPWLEVRPGGKLRVSPLVADAGVKTLSSAAVTNIHRAIADSLSARSPFDVALFPQLLVSALASQHRKGLTMIAVGALDSRLDAATVSSTLFVLPFLTTDRAIVDFDPGLNRMLRLAQLKVASDDGNVDRLLPIYRRLIVELEGAEGDVLQRRLAAWQLLSTEAPLHPSQWFEPLADLEAPVSDLEKEAFKEGGEALFGQSGMAPASVVFAIRTSRLRDLDDLIAWFDALDAVGDERRGGYLNPPEDLAKGLRTAIQMAWVRPSTKPDFDALAEVARFEDLRARAEGWGASDLALECLCCQVVLLSEYASQADEALALLAAAEAVWPSHPRLLRERAKILFAQDRFADVLADAPELLSGAKQGDAVEQAYVAREVALSAGGVGDLTRAIALLSQAEQAAGESESLAELAVGLAGDRAFLTWRAGDRATAISGVRDALLAAEGLDGQTERGKHVVQALGFLARAMHQDLTAPGWDKAYPTVYGIASRPPRTWTEGMPPSLLVAWYQLAAVERHSGLDCGVAGLLAERTKAGRIVAFELIERTSAFLPVLEGGDPNALVGELSEFARTFTYTLSERSKASDPATDPTFFDVVAALPWEGVFDPSNTTQMEVAEGTVLASTALAHGRGEGDWIQRLKTAAAQVPDLDPEVARFMANLPEKSALSDRNSDLKNILWSLDQIAAAQPTPRELFIATVQVFDWLGNSLSAAVVAAALAPLACARWKFVLENGRFGLRAPAVNAPTIEAAIAKLETKPDRPGLARLVIAASAAVDVALPEKIMAKLWASALGTL